MAHFFSKFSTINYTLDGFNKDAENILTSTVLKQINVNKALLVQNYDVPAGTSPEALANQLYGDPTLWQTFFLVNNKINPVNDWPMSDSALEEYVKAKYGSTTTIIHFVNLTTGDILDDVADAEMRVWIQTHPVPVNISPITSYAYESELNRQKGKIIIISEKFISKFIDTFNQSIQGKV